MKFSGFYTSFFMICPCTSLRSRPYAFPRLSGKIPLGVNMISGLLRRTHTAGDTETMWAVEVDPPGRWTRRACGQWRGTDQEGGQDVDPLRVCQESRLESTVNESFPERGEDEETLWKGTQGRVSTEMKGLVWPTTRRQSHVS